MADPRILDAGCKPDGSGKYVIYWMQQSQRIGYNHALNHAIELANEMRLPLVVIFVLSDAIPDANLRHYHFMFEGLAETAQSLQQAGSGLHICAGDPADVIAQCTRDAAALVTDVGYLRWQRDWRLGLRTKQMSTAYCEVESDVVVPVRTVSSKEEYAAATIRGKILRQLTQFLEPAPLSQLAVKKPVSLSLPSDIPHLFCTHDTCFADLLEFAIKNLKIDASVSAVSSFQGGYAAACEHLQTFLHKHLHLYAEKRNDPALNIQSDLSPYLHFGQISALEIALKVLDYAEIPAYAAADLIRNKAGLTGLQAGVASFLEELIVRRDLSCNFCHYNENYDSYAGITLWARKTLNDHLGDPRPMLYSPGQLENAQTSDPNWNAAQTELLITGKMHNYMRMYWGKKVIEWTPDPETAFHLLLWLNNKYSLDGRDPNSYAGIAWCFGKHDRPWQTRPVFGSIRYMNAQGLKRKFDMQKYIDNVNSQI